MSDTARRWNELLEKLTSLESSDELSESDHLKVVQMLGGLHLIQPFNWNAWGAELVPLAELDQLDILDCVRHITRIVRADRFSVGILAAVVSNGYLRAMCQVARDRAAGELAPALPKTA